MGYSYNEAYFLGINMGILIRKHTFWGLIGDIKAYFLGINMGYSYSKAYFLRINMDILIIKHTFWGFIWIFMGNY